MNLDVPPCFVPLRAYVDDRYVMHDGTGGEAALRENDFAATSTRAKTPKIHLLLPGAGLAFRLDHDQAHL